MLENDNKICIVCGEQKENSILIVDQSLCHTCEKKIVHTEVEHPSYSFFLDKLKKIKVSFVK